MSQIVSTLNGLEQERRPGYENGPTTPFQGRPSMPDKQLLHLVFGGQLERPDSDQFVDPQKLHIVGIFPNYESAMRAWRGATGATLDDAHMRYFIVHLHRLLDPTNEKKGKGGDDHHH
jgi:hypothetical protein